MNSSKIPRLMIAAASSGSGKTTVTCGLLQALKNRGLHVGSFKCGPDYIDPMFHSEVIGAHSRNLDLFFTNEVTTNYLLAKNGQGMDVSMIEGVMGYYDGLGGDTTVASSYDLAKATQTPVVLVVNCKGMSISVAAQIKGFLEFRQDSRICGVILNQVSAMLYPTLKAVIEQELPVKVLGYLPYLEDCLLESRHLGLVTAREIVDIKEKLQLLAKQMEESIEIDALLDLAGTAADVKWEAPVLPMAGNNKKAVIAVAKDEAFCFYYQDGLDLLQELGAELQYFSPLHDTALPDNASGLYLGGGYPELYAKALAENKDMLNSIKGQIKAGLPCFAECGGFLYLQESLEGADGAVYPMVGAVKGKSYRTPRLNRFGYIILTAQTDNLLCKKGGTIAAHEFHYWDSTNCGNGFIAQKPNKKRNWDCIITENNLFAGYPHIHFYANPMFAVNFVEACIENKENEKSKAMEPKERELNS